MTPILNKQVILKRVFGFHGRIIHLASKVAREIIHLARKVLTESTFRRILGITIWRRWQ
jgi:hypothetical protein